ncbi:MAG: 50S ribosomal protein L10 [Bacteroidota bacterium]
MTREEKTSVIAELSGKLAENNYFYITDASGMSVADVNAFRRLCFERGIEYKVYKNTLIAKALESTGGDYTEFNDKVLRGFSGVLFSKDNGKAPAKLLKEFYKGKPEKRPALKGASIDSATFIGAENLETLLTLKSREELLGEIIGLLQSPAKNVISALQSGGNKLAGILKTLSEKEG